MSLTWEQLLSFYYKDTCFLEENRIQLDKDASVDDEIEMVKKINKLQRVLEKKDELAMKQLQQYSQLESDIEIERLESDIDTLLEQTDSEGESLLQPFSEHIESSRKRSREKEAKTKSKSNEDEDEDDENLDMLVVSSDPRKRLRCPITGSLFVNPVKNIKCGHCYEKGAILRYLDKKKNMNCPVAGCKGTVTRNDLVEDSDMLWEVWRQK